MPVKLTKTLHALSMLMDESTSLLQRAKEQAELPVVRQSNGGYAFKSAEPRAGVGKTFATLDYHRQVLKDSHRRAKAVQEALHELVEVSAAAAVKTDLERQLAEYDSDAELTNGLGQKRGET